MREARSLRGPAGEGEGPPFVLAAAVLGLVAASRFLAVAVSAGEIDEAVFSGAITRYDLFDLSPQAPGFPLWILIGRALTPFTHSPFASLAIASAALSAIAVPALYAWGRRLVGGWSALFGVVFAASLPVVWVNAGRGFSDSPSAACFLVALALLSAADAVPIERGTRRAQMSTGRRARLYAVGAGLAAAAGAGIRPHLVLAFGPALLLLTIRLARRGDRHDAALSFVLAGAAGSLAVLGWLLAQAGGGLGLVASLSERAGFRSQAFATGRFGALGDSFLVRDFLSWRRALLVFALAIVGVAALLPARRAALGEIGLVLFPTFLSLWFLHSRAMSRYSVPFVLVLALLVGAGVSALGRRPAFGAALAVLLAFFFGRQAWPEVRVQSRETSPPMAAIAALERYVHPGRETIVADEDFHAFLRTERWEGRLVAWGYLDSELVAGVKQFNKRLVRLADFTDEGGPPDGAWRVFFHGGRAAEALGNGRLLSVALRDPAPPLFSSGFGVKEEAPGQPPFHWAGPAAHLLVPGLQGPPVALLSGERPGDAGETTLRVTDARTGRLVLTRRIAPGTFDLALVLPPVYGPLPAPQEIVLSCDKTVALPPKVGGVRPLQGCFLFRDATSSVAPDSLWESLGTRRFVEIGSPRDRLVDPEGFSGRETIPALSLDMRWTTANASVVWVPIAGFAPTRLLLRARAPSTTPVDVTVRVGAVAAGHLAVPPGDFTEVSLALPPRAAEALAGVDPVRISFSCVTWNPKKAGVSTDDRDLGIGVDRISLDQ